jgi:hypothetical protein
MAYKLGGNGAIYYGGTTRASWPTSGAAAGLAILNRVGDVKLNLEKGDEDSSTRDTTPYETSFAGFIKASIDFQLKYDSADAGYLAMEASYFSTNTATISLAILDGKTTAAGYKGLWADFQIFKFEKSEPVKGLQTVDVTVRPSLNTSAGTNVLPPSWVTGT